MWNGSKNCLHLEVKFKGKDSKDVIVHLREVFWESSAWQAKGTNCWGMYKSFKWSLQSLLSYYWGMAGTDECPEEIEISCVSASPGTRMCEATSQMPCPAVAQKMKKRMDKQVAADMGVRLDTADIERREMNTKKTSWGRNPGECVKCFFRGIERSWMMIFRKPLQ